MTDNEIIKALEFCEENKDNCYTCPVRDDCISKNMPFIGWALDLINRQKAEIIKEKNKNSKLRNERNHQKTEIERLRDALIDNEYANCVSVKNGLIYTHTLDDYDKLIGDISAEAIKEFAELLKTKFDQYGAEHYYYSLVDDVAKEMGVDRE